MLCIIRCNISIKLSEFSWASNFFQLSVFLIISLEDFRIGLVSFQVLDTVHMLFGDQHSPFITILAVDPHVIIKGIEHNLHGLFRESSINGHDYLRNIVHLPFFLQPSLRPTRSRKDSVGSDTAVNHASGSKFSVSVN